MGKSVFSRISALESPPKKKLFAQLSETLEVPPSLSFMASENNKSKKSCTNGNKNKNNNAGAQNKKRKQYLPYNVSLLSDSLSHIIFPCFVFLLLNLFLFLFSLFFVLSETSKEERVIPITPRSARIFLNL